LVLMDRRIVVPLEVLYACQISDVDFLEWVKEFVARVYGDRVEVSGFFEICSSTGEKVFPVLLIKARVPIREEELDELELELTSRIFGLFSRLTEKEKVILRRRVAEEWSLQQIASELGVKPQTVVTFLKVIRRKVLKWFLSSS